MSRHVTVLLAAAAATAACYGMSVGQEEAERARPEQLFEQLDNDGDGTLQADEIAQDRKRFFERLVRVADKNDDGALSRDEFLRGLAPDEDRGRGEFPAGGADRRPMFEPKQMIERFDGNGDEKLSRDELPEPLRERLAPLFQRLGKEELSADDLERARRAMENAFGPARDPGEFFRQLDQNGDGKLELSEVPEPMRERLRENVFKPLGKESVTREEYERAMRRARAQNRPPGPPDAAFGGAPACFRRLDSDGNGRLSKEELSRAAELLDELDADKDGSLDPRELFAPPPGDRPGPPDPNRRPGREQFGDVLGRFDKNQDGKLSRDEAPEWLKQRFERIDRNGDGTLDAQELRPRRGADGPRDRRPENRDRPKSE